MSGKGMFVKICGLQDAFAARVAVEAGADALGFILAPSRRQMLPGAVRAIRNQLLSGLGAMPTMVGVVVDTPAEEIEVLFEESGVDMIQLSGDEDVSILDHLDVPVIKALRFPAGTTHEVATREIDRWMSSRSAAHHVIVDGYVEGAYGGTGAAADWDLAAAIAEDYPILLAGGLDPVNVGAVVDRVHPAGVDVSSGVETNGVKDHAKIATFIGASRTSSR